MTRAERIAAAASNPGKRNGTASELRPKRLAAPRPAVSER